jgi:hypothetical protein
MFLKIQSLKNGTNLKDFGPSRIEKARAESPGPPFRFLSRSSFSRSVEGDGFI